jgi:hypothetical protein
MLATNGGCELPCWWGITPGVTSWEDAQRMFLSYGRSIGSRQAYARYWDQERGHTESYVGIAYDVSLLGRHDPYPFDYVVEHTLYEQDGTVQLLGAIGHALGGATWYTSEWPPPRHFAQDWQRYTLDQILSRFGPPSQVLLHYWPHEGALYSLAVLYEEYGILVAYMGAVQGEGEDTWDLDTVIICPMRSQINDINIWVTSPDMGISLVESFTNWRLGKGYYEIPFSEERSPSLEEATGMDIETFYETYLDPYTPSCLEARPEVADFLP